MNTIKAVNLIKDSFRSFAEKVEGVTEKLPTISVKKDLSGSTIRFDWPGWWKQLKMKNDGLCAMESDNWPGSFCVHKKDHDGIHGYA